MERTVDIVTDGRHLSTQRGFLLISKEREEVDRIPLEDVAAIIVHAHGVTLDHQPHRGTSRTRCTDGALRIQPLACRRVHAAGWAPWAECADARAVERQQATHETTLA